MQFADVDLNSALSQLFGVKRLEGKGTVVFAIDGSGENVDAITHTLSGDARLTSTSGAITGINVEQLLRRLERRPLSGGSDLRSGRTPYDKLSVTVKNIQTAPQPLRDVSARSSRLVKLSLTGTSSIPARDMDLRGTAALVSDE